MVPMTRTPLAETLYRLAAPVVESLGLEIWGLEILQSGRPLVRLYIHGPDVPAGDTSADPELFPEGVTVDQCAHVSRLLGLALDVENVFAGAYVLEVSSPGLSRVFFSLAQMRPYIGDTIDISLRDPLPAPLPENPLRKKFCGRLESVGHDALTLAVDNNAGQCVAIPWDTVRRAARVHIFAAPSKPGKTPRTAKTAAHTTEPEAV